MPLHERRQRLSAAYRRREHGGVRALSIHAGVAAAGGPVGQHQLRSADEENSRPACRLRKTLFAGGPGGRCSSDSAAAAVFEPLFAATVSWQQALKVYSSGLRDHDPAEVLRSFGYIRDAEDYQRQVRSLLSEP